MRYVMTILLFLITASAARATTECRTYDTLARIHDATTAILNNPDNNIGRANLRRLKAEYRFLAIGKTEILLAKSLTVQDQVTTRQFLDLSKRLSLSGDEGPLALQIFLQSHDVRTVLRQSRPLIEGLLCAGEGQAASTSASNLKPQASGGIGDLNALGPLTKLAISVGPIIIEAIVAAIGLIWLTLYLRKMWANKRRRKAKRYLVDVPVLFSMGAINYDGKLCDISNLGGRIKHNGIINPNKVKTMKVFVNNKWYEGRLMWGDSMFCGVAFNKTLTREELIRIRKDCRRKQRRKNRRSQKGVVTADQNLT